MQENGYTCIAGTAYSLLLYLLYHPLETIERTVFLLGGEVPGEVANVLPRCHYPQSLMLRWNHWLAPILRRCGVIRSLAVVLVDRIILWVIHMLFVAGRKVYAQDHIMIGSRLLCGTQYVLLEDGPGFYFNCLKSPYWQEKHFVGFEACKQWLLMGPIYGKSLGRNAYCKNRLVSEERDLGAEVLRGKPAELVSLESKWQTAPEGKKDLIKRVFGIDAELIEDFNRVETIIFTQPFEKDCRLTEDELVAIYRPYVEKYQCGGLLIKNHPRNSIEYSRHFPGVKVIDSRAPMQLISLACRPPKRAVTINSTAITALPCDVEVVWIGSGIDVRIKKYCSPHGAPKKFTNVIYPNGENWL